jgi:hypothetical protein
MTKVKNTLCMPTGYTTKAWISGKDGIAVPGKLDFILTKTLMSGVENVRTIILAMH